MELEVVLDHKVHPLTVFVYGELCSMKNQAIVEHLTAKRWSQDHFPSTILVCLLEGFLQHF